MLCGSIAYCDRSMQPGISISELEGCACLVALLGATHAEETSAWLHPLFTAGNPPLALA
ncbi:hypothetical protein [Chamaesiphon minutus]|uniref:hypothetical protein n=1 Tax=Chamaesiphon minutus TaxID=1173032 RepID=UPI0003109193|nr:hypothetical protein [Chamaesiphon minutus]